MREEHSISCNNINLHVVMDGPADGSPVLMLHGFPELWYCWHHQFDTLATQGYRVIAPDQRGYNLSDKPAGVQSYQIDILVEDIRALLDALGYAQVDLIAHDWGAAVALHFAEKFPERINHLVISNGTHLHLLTRSWLHNPRQLLHSAYIFFFQTPYVPEYFIRRTMANHSHSNPEALAIYKQALAQPNVPTAMLNWYRAAFRNGMKQVIHGLLHLHNPYPTPIISVPTLILWGEKDSFLTKKLAQDLLASCTNGQIHFFPDATHWLPEDKPVEVSQRILEFIQ
jgi:epoxide hydrolase 4